ncbi:MAG TPA: hypothetical protein VGM91_14360 [Conexibacter sp.]|jgi:hypothetical protein
MYSVFTQISDEISDQTGMHLDSRAGRLLKQALPREFVWTLTDVRVGDDEGPGRATLLALESTSRALFRVLMTREGRGQWKLRFERRVIDPADTTVTLHDVGHLPSGSALEASQRTWIFARRDDFSVAIKPEKDRDEEFARALAAAAGWTLNTE